MNRLATFTILLLTPFLCWTCKSSQLGPDSYDKRQIRFGSGGGFTGAVTTYALLETGQLFEQSMAQDSFSLLRELPRAQTKALFKEIEASAIDTFQYTSYGNFYHFVEWRDKEGHNRIAWASDDPKIDPTWRTMYASLKAIVLPTE